MIFIHCCLSNRYSVLKYIIKLIIYLNNFIKREIVHAAKFVSEYRE